MRSLTSKEKVLKFRLLHLDALWSPLGADDALAAVGIDAADRAATPAPQLARFGRPHWADRTCLGFSLSGHHPSGPSWKRSCGHAGVSAYVGLAVSRQVAASGQLGGDLRSDMPLAVQPSL
jgi:hypothetical protein